MADPPRACATRWGGWESVCLDVHPPHTTIPYRSYAPYLGIRWRAGQNPETLTPLSTNVADITLCHLAAQE